MNIQPQYLAYLGGSEKEEIEIGDIASWKQYRNKYFYPYPMLFPVDSDINEARENMKSIAWSTWAHTPSSRIFVVYFKQIIARSFVNFIFMVYEDADGSKTRELCKYKAEDWIKVKNQILQNSSDPINIATVESPEEKVTDLLARWDNHSGLALRFPRRYKNDSYSGCFDGMSTIFPETEPEEPGYSFSPEIEQESGDCGKKKSRKSLWIILLLCYAGGMTVYGICSIQALKTHETTIQSLQKEIQQLKQQLIQQKQVTTSNAATSGEQ